MFYLWANYILKSNKQNISAIFDMLLNSRAPIMKNKLG